MLLLTLKRQEFVQNFCCWKTVLNIVWFRIPQHCLKRLLSWLRHPNCYKVHTNLQCCETGAYFVHTVLSSWINAELPYPQNMTSHGCPLWNWEEHRIGGGGAVQTHHSGFPRRGGVTSFIFYFSMTEIELFILINNVPAINTHRC